MNINCQNLNSVALINGIAHNDENVINGSKSLSLSTNYSSLTIGDQSDNILINYRRPIRNQYKNHRQSPIRK